MKIETEVETRARLNSAVIEASLRQVAAEQRLAQATRAAESAEQGAKEVNQRYSRAYYRIEDLDANCPIATRTAALEDLEKWVAMLGTSSREIARARAEFGTAKEESEKCWKKRREANGLFMKAYPPPPLRREDSEEISF